MPKSVCAYDKNPIVVVAFIVFPKCLSRELLNFNFTLCLLDFCVFDC